MMDSIMRFCLRQPGAGERGARSGAERKAVR